MYILKPVAVVILVLCTAAFLFLILLSFLLVLLAVLGEHLLYRPGPFKLIV